MGIERGVLYLMTGTRVMPVTAVSIFTLREHYGGPIALYVNNESRPFAERIAAAAGDCMVLDAPAVKLRKNSAYTVKTLLPQLSPFNQTIQIDGDTIIVGDISELWPKYDGELILTQFAAWVTTGNMMRHRLQKWLRTEEAWMALEQMKRAHPAINTGILAYDKHCDPAMSEWPMVNDLRRGEFISDELAMQLIAGRRAYRLADCRYNASPIYPNEQTPELMGDVRIWHFHGRKHLHPKARELWFPKYQAATFANFGGIAEWSPAGDARLATFLETGEDRPEPMEE